jgi:hypothetical protein
MLKKLPIVLLLTTMRLTPWSGLQQHAAMADDVIDTTTPPVLTVHSNGGTINITSSNDSTVHVLSGPAAQTLRVSRFDPRQMGSANIILPERFVRQRFGHGWRVFRLPPRQFTLPVAKFGSEGVNVENPGGDMSIAVPKRVGAIFINADAGNVNMRKVRGPYIISATAGEVRMLNVAGAGLIRTTSGNVTLGGVGGNVHVQTVSGAVTVFGSYADSVDVQSDNGPIYWRFIHCGNGVYRFRSKQGSIRLGFRAAASAQVDAQSDTGLVQNLFSNGAASGSAIVRLLSPHALSMDVNGGGPEITATTTSGGISIESIAEPPPTSQPGQSPNP